MHRRRLSLAVQARRLSRFALTFFRQDTISGAHIVKNRFLKRVLAELGLDTDEVWSDLIAHDGSVQHRTDLPQQVRDVFKTAQEIDQRWIIELAADPSALH